MAALIYNSIITSKVLTIVIFLLANMYATVQGQRNEFFFAETGISFVRSQTKDFGTLRLHKPYVNYSTPFIYTSIGYGQSLKLNKLLEIKGAAGLGFGGYRYRIYQYAARDAYTIGRNQIFATLNIQSIFNFEILEKNVLKYGIGVQIFGNILGFWKDGSSYDYFADSSIHPLMIAPRLDVSCNLGNAVYSLSLLHSVSPLVSTNIQNNYFMSVSAGVYLIINK